MNLAQLQKIVPPKMATKAADYFPFLIAAMTEFEINTPLRQAAFIAQILVETGNLQWMQELWGPTEEQKRYEPPHAKARELGNIKPGDGERFKGRGAIMLTGRANYAAAGQALGLDLIGDPLKAAYPDVSFRIAAYFWTKHKLNVYADRGEIDAISHTINGGINGREERRGYFRIAKKVLGIEI